MSGYQYSPLAQPDSSIRLLQLLPRREDPNQLCCKLFECVLRNSDDVSRPRPFEALSYSWDSHHETRSIIIVDDGKDKQKGKEVGDQELAVTENLYKALLSLQDHDISRIIWADAVCIDQSNTEEKQFQIPLMAEIYATASQVIVWLGEAGDDSDQALEAICAATESPMNVSKTQLSVQAVSALLKRRWFDRIWVLQEVAAARHVLIKCGSMEIDGYAFCLGSDIFSTDLKQPISQVTFLIRGSIFRSRAIRRGVERLSLDICSLGELVDMYHTHQAEKFHDKVYALLGMCSDNLEDLKKAGLEPDYTLEQTKFLQRLIKFVLGDQISIETWKDKEIAVIESKGCVLGKVSKVESKVDLGGNVQSIEAIFGYTPRKKSKKVVCWTIRTSAKPVLVDDIICFLPGALKPAIIRSRGDYFAIIMVAAVLPEQIMWPEPLQSASFTRNLLLVWDWETSSENFHNSFDDLTQTKNLQSKHSGGGLGGKSKNTIRRLNVVLLFRDLGEYEKAEEELFEAVGDFVQEEHLYIQREAVVRLLLETANTGAGFEDEDGRNLLSSAAAKGHSIVVKLLLGTGKANIEAKDRRQCTALSLAAWNGHEAVVEQLIKAKANIEAKDRRQYTALSLAAQNGHEFVIEQLTKAKADIEVKNSNG